MFGSYTKIILLNVNIFVWNCWAYCEIECGVIYYLPALTLKVNEKVSSISIMKESCLFYNHNSPVGVALKVGMVHDIVCIFIV